MSRSTLGLSLALALALAPAAAFAEASIDVSIAINTNSGGMVSIAPDPPGQTLVALGHQWGWCPAQDWGGGYCLTKDGLPTSDHGVRLDFDGTALVVTWHHPYPFDPATGAAWTPPLYHRTVRTDPSYVAGPFAD